MTTTVQPVRWEHPSLTRVPYTAYTDPALYAQEQARVFRGATWNYLCLEAEIAEPGRLDAICACNGGVYPSGSYSFSSSSTRSTYHRVCL